MITGADEAIAAHQRVAEASWREAVKGPAGAALVTSVWFLRTGESAPRFVTAYPGGNE